MKCTKCGKEIAEAAKFCSYCGAENKKIEPKEEVKHGVAEKKVESKDYKKSKNSMYFFVMICVAILLAIIVITVGMTTKAVSPVYRTESYEEPKYGILYSGNIGEYHFTGNENYRINIEKTIIEMR